MKQRILLACLIGVALFLSFQLFQHRSELNEAPLPNSTADVPRPTFGAVPDARSPLPPGVKGNLSLDDQVEFAEMPPTRPFKLITKEMGARKNAAGARKSSR